MNKKLLTAAIAGLTIASVSTTTHASGGTKVQCKGIALKKMNDCGAKGHGCAGKAAKDFDPNEWVYTKDQAECDALQKAVKNPAVKSYLEAVSKKAQS